MSLDHARRIARTFAPMGILLLAGCQGTLAGARQDVVNISAYQERLVSGGAYRVRLPEVDGYLDDLARRVLDSARELSKRDKSQPGGNVYNVYNRFSVYLVHEDAPNAFTYGTNFACVTTSLLLDADTPEEIVGVLGHEFGHIYSEHSTRRRLKIRQEADKTVALSALAGGIGGLTGSGMQLPLAVIRARQQYLASYNPFERADEFTADACGLEVYLNMGLAPERFDDALERSLRAFGEGGGTTHPRNSARLKAIAAQVQSHPMTATRSELDRDQLRRIQHLLAVELFRLSDRRTLVAFSAVNQSLRAQGYLVYPADACGVFDVDPAILNSRITAAAIRHRDAR